MKRILTLLVISLVFILGCVTTDSDKIDSDKTIEPNKSNTENNDENPTLTLEEAEDLVFTLNLGSYHPENQIQQIKIKVWDNGEDIGELATRYEPDVSQIAFRRRSDDLIVLRKGFIEGESLTVLIYFDENGNHNLDTDEAYSIVEGHSGRELLATVDMPIPSKDVRDGIKEGEIFFKVLSSENNVFSLDLGSYRPKEQTGMLIIDISNSGEDVHLTSGKGNDQPENSRDTYGLISDYEITDNSDIFVFIDTNDNDFDSNDEFTFAKEISIEELLEGIVLPKPHNDDDWVNLAPKGFFD